MKNSMAKGAHLAGTSAQGDRKADVNMPAKNHGTFSVSLGSGKDSKFGNGVSAGAAQKGFAQPKNSPKANIDANNITDRKVAMGNTKHAVGTVPAYLRGKN